MSYIFISIEYFSALSTKNKQVEIFIEHNIFYLVPYYY